MNVRVVNESDLFVGGEDRNVFNVSIPATIELMFDTKDEITVDRVKQLIEDLMEGEADREHVLGINAEVAVTTDRPHRFAEGDLVVHVDSPGYPMEVEAATWREVAGVRYPTYTVYDPSMNERIADVLDTLDLEAVKAES